MKKSDLLTLGLTDELAEKVAALSAEEMKEFIPKSRFNEVNEAQMILEGFIIIRINTCNAYKCVL